MSGDLSAQDTALVYVIDTRNEIGSGLGTYISDSIQEAENAGADAIVFDVDTPGGRVDSAINIIRSIQDTQIPTIAFVNRQAISAGAMISIACNQIVMTSGGTIGDSAPVNIQGQEVGEKAISYIQGTIRATAERENRNPDIAEAMVDKELILVKLTDGQIVKLLPEEYDTLLEEGEEMEILCAQGKLLTLSTQQALEYGFADAQAETLTELLAQYEIVEVSGTKLPLTEGGIAQRQRDLGVSEINRLKTLAGARVTEVEATLADRIVFFITNPLISSLLLSLGVLGILIEIRTPGFGIPGFIGLLCVGLFFGGHMLTKIGAEWAFLLFLIGVGLIVLKVISMRHRKDLLNYVLLFIGCLFMSGDLSAQDTALVYVIDIRNEIGSGLGTYISDSIQEAENAGADAIVFDVDTPGGRVDSAINIIRSIQDTQIPTIAFVNRQAISAGAMISIACNQIVMTSGGTIGDSAPVNIQGQEVGEKAISYIQGTIRATAERENRNPDIAEAMVDKELILVKLTDGQIVKLLPEEYDTLLEEGEEMEILCAQGKLLTLSTQQALEYGFADAQAETLTELLAQYEIVEVSGTKLPLTEGGIAQRQRDLGVSEINRLKTLAGARVTEVEATLADRIVFFITNPLISSLLLSLGVLGILIEIRTPGFGIPGFIGLLCVGLFFGGHMLTKIGAEWAFLLFLIGVGLIVLEVFVIPGFGVAGILGITLMLGSIFFVFDKAYDFQTAIMWLSISVVLTSGLVILAAFLLPDTALFRRFALSTVMDTEMGYHSPGSDDFQGYLGQSGTALTPLRPSGTARIGGNRVDVVTVGNFIAQDSDIKVVEVEGSKVFVEAVEDV